MGGRGNDNKFVLSPGQILATQAGFFFFLFIFFLFLFFLFFKGVLFLALFIVVMEVMNEEMIFNLFRQHAGFITKLLRVGFFVICL